MIDLHVHSNASDGTVYPPDLVDQARAAGLTALAICDHDTVAAYDELPATVPGLTLIRGVELSIDFPAGTCHLLGYHFDLSFQPLIEVLDELRTWRAERNLKILEQMTALGLPVTVGEVLEEAGLAVPGRPHMARVLMRKGVVGSIQEAFDRYLAAGRPCYVPKSRLSMAVAIELIHQAGGAAVVAHPYQLKLDDDALAQAVARWKDDGLDGIEAYYGRHTPEMIATYTALAERYDLCVTVGSDYHGVNKPDIGLGRVPGTPPPDQVVLDGLRAAAERWRR